MQTQRVRAVSRSSRSDNKRLGLRLGVAFAVLIVLSAGIGQFGLRRMQTQGESPGDHPFTSGKEVGHNYA
jgi:hypothetical protein